MKKILLILSFALSLNISAQIHPASLWSFNAFYNAPPNHTKEVWTVMGFAYYTINITRDANNYITDVNSSTQTPLTADQFKVTGSKTGNVYTAVSQKSKNGTGPYRDWRRDTWKSDGTNDTLVMWEDYDSITAVWKNVSKNSITYSGGLIQNMTSYLWNTGTSVWDKASKNDFTYTGSNINKINVFNWDAATSAWLDGGNMQYFFTGNKLDSMQEWRKDGTTGITSLKYRFIMTADANNKTASFQQYQWKASTSVWESSLNIAFTGGSTGISTLSQEEGLKIYPNPANSRLTVECSQTKVNRGNIKLIAMDGKEVFNSIVMDVNTVIETGSLTNGLYILVLESDGVITQQQKVLIAH